jgi:hypothetical protein
MEPTSSLIPPLCEPYPCTSTDLLAVVPQHELFAILALLFIISMVVIYFWQEVK